MSDAQLVRVCLRVRKDDYEYIRRVAEATDTGGMNHMIRTILHSYVTQMRAVERKHLDKVG